MEQIAVHWHNILVGHVIDPQSDMWYLEGLWQPAPGPHTDTFLARAASLDPKAFMHGKQRGLVINLHFPQAGREPSLALVMIPPLEKIYVRRVIAAKAIEVVSAWEKEEFVNTDSHLLPQS